ncbi:MAG: APC family permease [Alphaproteobacteria bacterium]
MIRKGHGQGAQPSAKAPQPGVAPTLRRALSLPMMVLYGLGTTIGAGIYVLIGSVADAAGMHTPVSFLLASLMAGFTAFSFAELTARYPKSAGEALFAYQGFGRRWLALSVGLAMTGAVIVSGGAIVRGFTGYLLSLVAAPEWLVITALILALGLVAAWGILQSVLVAALLTLVEIGGLLLVIVVGAKAFGDLPARYGELLPPFDGLAWSGILTGAILAFYAFIGFESMVNVAEEVKDVRRNLPRAIVLTLGITTLLYVSLALIAVLLVPPAELAAQRAPLAYLFERGVGHDTPVLRLIGALSALNGAFIEIIVAARIIYGLSAQGWLPSRLSTVHPRTQTPLVATALVVALTLLFALFVPIAALAETTALITLGVFAIANLALIAVKRREPGAAGGGIVVPIWVPAAGFVISAGFFFLELVNRIIR